MGLYWGILTVISEGGRMSGEQESSEASTDIASQLVELWREEGVELSLPLRIIEPLGDTGFIVELPWNRFFEIELIPTDNRNWVPQIIPVSSSM